MRSASLIVVGLMLMQGVALAQSVGNVGAVNPRAASTPPNASAPHVLALGASVINKERIETSGDGTAQVTFLDKSTLNVGHNSSVVIDKFIYDQAAGTGEMAASMTKGVLRFVGGQISHTNGASVNTPVATIGIRGGTATIIFLPGGHVMVIDQFGRIDVRNQVSSQTILRPSYAVEVDGLNIPIGPPFPVPQNISAEAMALLTSRPGQHGGAHKWPDKLVAARFGIGNGRLPNDPSNTPGPEMIGIINLGDTFVTNRSQQQQVNGIRVPQRPTTQPATPTTTNNNNAGGGTVTTGGGTGGSTTSGNNT